MRWRLTQKHYLMVPGTEYEYTEYAQGSRRQTKRKFVVPRHLDPSDPMDCNYNPGGAYRSELDADRGYQGELIVCHEGKGQEKDIVFFGNPTLDMVPLDDEAKALTAEMEVKWKQQFVGDSDDDGYSGKLLIELTETLNAFNAQAVPSTPAHMPDPDIAALKDMVKDLVGALAATAAPKLDRRV